ncbi:MAG TPA: hypothetical protein VH834_15795 [Solirubrobacteraceae bacterium]
MGRRSRKRGVVAPAPEPLRPRPVPATPRPRARMEEAPEAPWSPFPLSELVVFIALVLIVAGFFADGPRRAALLGCGFVLVTLAGLELALREHFAGYRSHSTLLAGAAAIAVVAPLYLLTGVPQLVLLAVGAGVFALVLVLARNAFRRRSGGLGFRA